MSHAPDPMRQGETHRPVLFGICAAIGITLAFQIGSGFLVYPFRDDFSDAMVRMLLAFSYLLMMIWPAWIFTSHRTSDPGGFLRLRPASAGYYVAVIIGTLALSQLLQSYLLVQEIYLVPPDLADAYRTLDREAEKFYVQLLVWNDVPGLFLSMMAGAFMPAVAEELLFRGLAQGSFERRVRPMTAVILAAFLFAVLHLRPVTFIPLFLLGAFFGYVALRSGSVLPAMLGHFIFNAIAIASLYEPARDRAGSGEVAHTLRDLLEMLPITVVALAVFVLVFRWIGNAAVAREPEDDGAGAP